MPKKIRVYELARELGLTNKEALDLALSLGIGVKSHSSSIEEAQADRVRRKADAEGLRRPVQPEEVPASAKKAPPGRPAAESTPSLEGSEGGAQRPRLVTSRGAGAPARPGAPAPAASGPLSPAAPAPAAPA
ncbi:MAG: translation initiation factor IF-2 N-terminal domain-containing protein, partial [Acidimicrobiales bacterium]